RSVVIQVRQDNTERSRLHARGKLGPAGQNRDLPSLTPFRGRETLHNAVVAQGDQVEVAAVHIADGHGEVVAEVSGERYLPELAVVLVGEDVQLALRVEKCGIRKTIVIQVRPDEYPHCFQCGKGLYD